MSAWSCEDCGAHEGELHRDGCSVMIDAAVALKVLEAAAHESGQAPFCCDGVSELREQFHLPPGPSVVISKDLQTAGIGETIDWFNKAIATSMAIPYEVFHAMDADAFHAASERLRAESYVRPDGFAQSAVDAAKAVLLTSATRKASK